jgi:DNA-binding response OmpR family regulator
MRILLAEDNPTLSDSLSQALRLSGYEVDVARDGNAADSALRTKDAYAVVILDLGLPGMTGWKVLQALRMRRDATPVLILTALDAIDNKVQTLDIGADDYLVKPFSMAELEARLRVLVRRQYGHKDNTVVFGPLRFDTAARLLTTLGDERIELTLRETALIELLMRKAPAWVSKEVLINQLGSWESELSPNAVEVAVHRLRKRLEAYQVMIVTVRGLGYQLQERLR